MVRLTISYLVVVLFIQNIIYINYLDDSIDKYIELSVELNTDTVYMNNDLKLTVIFKNKTNDNILFYPKSILSLIKVSGGFELDGYFLHRKLDFRKIVELSPHGVHKEIFIVQIKPPFFKKGMNLLQTCYLCKKQKGQLKSFNRIHGSLESNEFKIFVKQSNSSIN